MAASFLHGVETIEINDGVRSVNEVRTGVIGLVGIAPTTFGKNKCVLVRSDADAAQFGKKLPGFDIPQSLDHILKQGSGAIIVVNVFDEATHTTQVTAEATVIADGKANTTSTPAGIVTILGSDDQALPFTKGVDYLLDDFGRLKVIAGRIANGTAIKFTYKKLTTSAVTTADYVGTVDSGGNKTGMKCWLDAQNLFGFAPKLLVAPGRSATKTVADEMLSLAERLRAVAIIDSTYGASVATAISERGDATKAFGTANRRAIPVYPYVKAYDESKDSGEPGVDTNTDFPYSPFMAGIISKTDNELGYWYSPSNKDILGATGLERNINASVNDANSDSNVLNEAGIATVFNAFGTGYKTWGNRNASFPSKTTADNFISILRISDTVHESLEQATVQFLDLPGTQGLIDAIRETGNAFVRTLIGRGALIDGSRVTFDKGVNPPTELANGHYTFTITLMGPTPAERITYYSHLDINLLTSLK